MDAEGKKTKDIRHYQRKVDNKMRTFGSVDLRTREVKINKSKKKNSRGEILDTIVHEKMHIRHPGMYERTIRKQTARQVAKMSRSQKQRHYGLFRT